MNKQLLWERMIFTNDWWHTIRQAHACIARENYLRHTLRLYPSNAGVVAPRYSEYAREYLEYARSFPALKLP